METEKDNVSFRWHDTFVARWLSLLFIPSKLPICVCAWRSARTHCSCLLFCFLQMEMQEREREIHCTPHQFSRNAMMEYCALHDGNICSCERYFHLVFRKPMGMDLPFSRRWTKFPDFTLGIFPMRGIWKCGDVYNNHGIPFRFTMRYEKMIRHTAPSLSLFSPIPFLIWRDEKECGRNEILSVVFKTAERITKRKRRDRSAYIMLLNWYDEKQFLGGIPVRG